ncbi:hypothetical protein ACWIGW_44005 [Nocardia brasiliensis]|uniref:hypothetical protein n=1 Tax=Streptomyces sp. NPDC056056 TaxID=3345698 RepID=UPI0035DE9E3B
MSTAVQAENAAKLIEPEAVEWLSATELAGIPQAIIALSRAVSPGRHGLTGREALTLPELTSDSGARVMRLLRGGQTPTPKAVLRLDEASGFSSKAAKKRAKTRAWLTKKRQTRDIITITKNANALGEWLASAVAAYWQEHGTGPHWSEAVEDPRFVECWTAMTERAYIGREFQPNVFHTAKRLGWVAFNHQERSLCTGRRFHRHLLAEEVSKAPHEDIGYFAGAFISIHHAISGHFPSWAQIAALATDHDGIRLFLDADDAAAQARWLSTLGWVMLRDGEIQPGKRVVTEAHQRGHGAPGHSTDSSS